MTPQPYDEMLRRRNRNPSSSRKLIAPRADRWETLEECVECGVLFHTVLNEAEFRAWWAHPTREPRCRCCTRP